MNVETAIVGAVARPRRLLLAVAALIVVTYLTTLSDGGPLTATTVAGWILATLGILAFLWQGSRNAWRVLVALTTIMLAPILFHILTAGMFDWLLVRTVALIAILCLLFAPQTRRWVRQQKRSQRSRPATPESR